MRAFIVLFIVSLRKKDYYFILKNYNLIVPIHIDLANILTVKSTVSFFVD